MRTLRWSVVGFVVGLVAAGALSAQVGPVIPGGTGGSGGAPTTSTYILQTADLALPAAQVLALQPTGLLNVTTATGVLNSIVPTDDDVLVGSGTAWQLKTITNCHLASEALSYTAATNTFGCTVITGGTPGGADTQVQFNDGGAVLGGDADFVWNKTTNILTINGAVTANEAQLAGAVNATLSIDKSGSLGVKRFSLFVGDGTGGTTADVNYIKSLNTDLVIWAGAAGTTEVGRFRNDTIFELPSTVYFTSRSVITSPSSSAINFTTADSTKGVGFNLDTDGVLLLRVRAQNAYATFDSLGHKLSGVLLETSTPPTISSGFGGSPTIDSSNGTATFRVDVGTGTSTSGVVALPTAATGWNCSVQDFSTLNVNTHQTASTNATVTVTTTVTPWAAHDILVFNCAGY